VGDATRFGIARVFDVVTAVRAHLAEELWDKFHSALRIPNSALVTLRGPGFDPVLLVENEIEIPVQVNGKLRDVIKVPVTATNAELEALALKNEKVQSFIQARPLRK
jgi:leucyl-tRNA synthetase